MGVKGPVMLDDEAAPMQCFEGSDVVAAEKYITKLPSVYISTASVFVACMIVIRQRPTS